MEIVNGSPRALEILGDPVFFPKGSDDVVGKHGCVKLSRPENSHLF